MVELLPSKQKTRVRFPSLALAHVVVVLQTAPIRLESEFDPQCAYL